MRRNRHAFARVLVLGGGRLASRLIEELKSTNGFNHVVLGFVDDEPHEESRDGVRLPGARAGFDEGYARERDCEWVERRHGVALELESNGANTIRDTSAKVGRPASPV